jgi:hypothetical protein
MVAENNAMYEADFTANLYDFLNFMFTKFQACSLLLLWF